MEFTCRGVLFDGSTPVVHQPGEPYDVLRLSQRATAGITCIAKRQNGEPATLTSHSATLIIRPTLTAVSTLFNGTGVRTADDRFRWVVPAGNLPNAGTFYYNIVATDGGGQPTPLVPPTECIVAASLYNPDDPLTPAAAAYTQGLTRRMIYTVTAEAEEFIVPLSPAEADDGYGAYAFVIKGGDGTVVASCPNDEATDRQTTSVRILTTAPLSAGDKLEIFLTR